MRKSLALILIFSIIFSPSASFALEESDVRDTVNSIFRAPFKALDSVVSSSSSLTPKSNKPKANAQKEAPPLPFDMPASQFDVPVMGGLGVAVAADAFGVGQTLAQGVSGKFVGKAAAALGAYVLGKKKTLAIGAGVLAGGLLVQKKYRDLTDAEKSAMLTKFATLIFAAAQANVSVKKEFEDVPAGKFTSSDAYVKRV